MMSVWLDGEDIIQDLTQTKEQAEAELMGCLIWDMMSMRCSDNNSIPQVLSRWSCPGDIGIGGFGTKGFSRNCSKGHFIVFNYTWQSSSEKTKSVFIVEFCYKALFKDLFFFSIVKNTGLVVNTYEC